MKISANTYLIFGYFSVALLGRYCDGGMENQHSYTFSYVDARQICYEQLKRAWLWRVVRRKKYGHKGIPTWLVILLILSGDVELNPGPKTNTSGVPRCCRCNRSGLCRNCSCSKAGRVCISCLPNDLGSCHNITPACPSQHVGSSYSQPPIVNASNVLLPTTSSIVIPSLIAQQSGTLHPSLPKTKQTSLLGDCSNLVSTCSSSQPAISSNHPDKSITKVSGSTFGVVPPIDHLFSASQPQSSTSLSPLDSATTFSQFPTITRSVSLPSLDSISEVSLPTLQHVPKGARDVWANIVADLCLSIVRDPSVLDSWQKFFMLPRCILTSPFRGGRTQWRVTQNLVKSRIRRWLAGEFFDLWDEVLAVKDKMTGKQKKKPRKFHPETLRKSNARRARKAVEDGQYRKAIQALTSGGLASVTPEVLVEMMAKHPHSSPPPISPDPTTAPPNISEQDVFKALKSFPTGSAPGPSGLRANHLKEAVLCPSPDCSARAIRALTNVVRCLCAGNVPREVVPHLCGATLLPIRKKVSGLRPIAVGEVLRRLTSKCLSRAVQVDALSTLTPLQLGVGVKVGCEAIVHSVSRVLEDPSIPSDNCWTLMLDFTNAFNSIDRGRMFEEIRNRIPSLTPWIECCYGAQPILHLGNDQILSCCGVQQGDPLGPLGFALTLQPILERMKAEVPGLKINAWYLDDGTLCGSPNDLAAALRIVEQDGPSCGLKLNRAKSLLYIADDADTTNNPLPSDIPITRNGFTLLGCPIGPSNYCDDAFSKRVRKVKESLSRLSDLEDSQMEMALLRSCLALPKVSFSLRSCPPDYIREGTAIFDDALRDALSDIAGSPLSDWAWLKASLPSSYGGLNIRRASLHAPAAYVSSLAQSCGLIDRILEHTPDHSIHLASSISALSDAAGRPDWVSMDDIDVPLRQRPLSHSIDEATHQVLLSSAPDTRSSALALSTSLPHAGDWLNVVPSTSLGLHLHDKEFRLCLQYWLGLRMAEDGTTCPVCQRLADGYGDHQVGCGGNGDRIYRHNSIRDAIFSAAQSAALAPRKEAPSLIPGSSSRPADVYLPNWKRGQPAALDITVISTMQQQTLAGASITPGHALQVGDERKMAAHAGSCRAVGVQFIPLVVETLGGWSQDAIDTISSIGRLQGQRLGIPPPESTSHLFQRLAITLWKGNASLWIRRQSFPPANVDGLF